MGRQLPKVENHCSRLRNKQFWTTFVISRFSVPPEEVVIVGEKTVRADNAVSYSCLANNANPAPTIEWTVNGKSWTSGVNTFTHPPPASSNRRLSGEDDSMPGNYYDKS